MKGYTVATAIVNPLMKRSRQAVKFIEKQDGLLGVHPTARGTLWIFDSKANAIRAKNVLESEGIKTGDNIVEIEFDMPDGGCKK